MDLITMSFIILGLIALFGIFYVITIIDAIRDKNWIWLIIVLLFPVLGLILYWLFGNIKS